MMFETLNKRLWPAMAAEARENAQRYWARKTDSTPPTARPDESLSVPQDAPKPFPPPKLGADDDGGTP